ncbi:uncharacterized protein NPIL_122091 [Nephila pilipes]|uniref:Uncharacterized protein n=1 Tax=Nephila pilipes TaxID=299642 RepID=A0A8X6T6T7_NEPPI|nr:uncharacterized protein NPIL_122091 [Nephila pilipes]
MFSVVNHLELLSGNIHRSNLGLYSIDNAVIGSYYSDGNWPSFCFTINTLWSRPDTEIQKIKKSEKIQIEFFIDTGTTYTGGNEPLDEVKSPRFNFMSPPEVLMAIHSPYIVASPYITGERFLGGRNYRVKIKADEKHLLPSPYQTNCTEYLPQWKARGRVGPLNPIMAVQECRLNATLEKLGCIPNYVDYPHNKTICKSLYNNQNITHIGENCTDLQMYYNQPCNFLVYLMKNEAKLVPIQKGLNGYSLETQYNCTSELRFTRRCQTANVEVVFDGFEITNMTYNPKFESLELFSVIGGYMGMYLGVSLVVVYDFAEFVILAVYKFSKKQTNVKKLKSQKSIAWKT